MQYSCHNKKTKNIKLFCKVLNLTLSNWMTIPKLAVVYKLFFIKLKYKENIISKLKNI